VTLEILAPPGTAFGPSPSISPAPAVSPDGRHLAFVAAGEDAVDSLWVRSLASTEARELPDTEGARFPFWSRDSRFVAFFAGGLLRRVAIDGGPSVTICEAPAGEGGAWNEQGTIVFAPTSNWRLYGVSWHGGVPVPVTRLEESRGERGHEWPSFLPDGRRFLYFVRPERAIYLGSLGADEPRRLFEAETKAVYVNPGLVLFMRDGVLLAQPFDEKAASVVGRPIPIAASVAAGAEGGRAAFSASPRVLAFRTTASLQAPDPAPAVTVILNWSSEP
jgi:hypothetical protein